ncbi:accessory Sec system protein Asp3 [Limosilactobacillus ingluviei]|uniref:Accessory Sec system protein Asp3 n=1 Tax=Limosilactobacillus ingluviei TaxID=148604 RepID=A0A0R2GUZ1_9LACO|nr:accessory Sec system protein Asp3 [Limosilactobacillus ingluviei]KRN44608.1 hypothetical protein IV41_GL000300 [Limosilactobacillus ingluviei]
MDSIYIKSPADLYYRGMPGEIRDGVYRSSKYYGSSGQSATHAYLHGTRLKFLARDHVEIRNPFLPTGSTIYHWDEMFNFSTAHAVPQLPLLAHNHHYQLHLVAESNYEAGLYLRVLMFDYESKLVKMQIIRQATGIFTFVPEAYFYAIELVSAGCTEVIFHRLDLTDVTAEVQPQVEAAAQLAEDDDVEDVVVNEELHASVNYQQLLVRNATHQEQRLAIINQYLD